MLGGMPEELQDIDYLFSRGVRICLQGHQPFMAAVQAIHDTLKSLKAGVAPSKLEGIANAELIKQVSRDADYKAWQEEFLN